MKKHFTFGNSLQKTDTKIRLVLFLCLLSVLKLSGQTMPVAQNVPYSQDFSTLNGSSTSYPAGWQGWQIAAATPSSTGRITSPASDRTISGGTAASTNSGVYDFNGKIGFLSTASADLAICLAVNTIGYNNLKVTFDVMTMRNLYNGSTEDRINGLVLQYRVGTTGDFTILSYGTEYKNGTTAQTTGTTGIDIVTGLNAVLPSACDNQSVVQIRWIYRNVSGTAGSRPSMALDNVIVNEYQPTTYTWNATGTASYATAANWTPARTTPLADDILQINGSGTIILTNVPTQTIGQLHISNNTTVELQSTVAATLTIAGYTGTDLSVEAGSALNIAQTTNAITIAVGAGATGSIAGSVTYTNAAHKLTAANASGITFQNGSSFTAGTGFSGNAFGASGSVSNSVVFSSGSTYIAIAGSNPFANNQPNSVVVFNTGSLYKIIGNVTPSFSGRTYANLEIDAIGQTFSLIGNFAVNIDNLTVTNGTLNINMTNATNAIKGNITVATGAALAFNPATAGTFNLNGTSTQTISGSGTFTVSSLADFVVANTVVLDKNINFGGALTINSIKSLSVNPGKQLTVSTAFTNNGTLNLLSSDIGTATILPPASITGSGTTTVQQYLPHARNWYVSSPVSGAVAPVGYSYYQRDEVGSSWTTQPFVFGNTFTQGKGYIALPSASGSTLTFSGTLNTSNVNVSLTKSGSGFNLIGNPYPSHLGWTYDFANANAALIESSIWVRTNAGTANNSGQWSFATFNAVALESVPSVANAGIIAPMQAFWVKAKTAGTLTLNSNLTRSHQSSNPLKVPTVKNTDRQRIRLQVSNGLASDETLLYFDANAADVFDAYDSPKININNATTPEIFTQIGTEKLVINGMTQPAYDVEIPLGFTTGGAANFTISKIEMSNFEAGTRLLLKDKLNITSEFDLSEGDAYNFSSGILNNSNNRFSLVLKAPGTTTGHKPENSSVAQVFVNAANQITIIAPEKSNYAIYNAIGMMIENGQTTAKLQTANYKLNTGVYVVKVNNQSTRVIIK